MNGRNDDGRERRAEGRGRGGNGRESFEGFEQRPRNWREEWWGQQDESWRGGERPGRGEPYQGGSWESQQRRGWESQRESQRGRREMSGSEWRDRFGGRDWEQPVYAGGDPHDYGASEQEAAWGPRAGRTGRGWSGQERDERWGAGPDWQRESQQRGEPGRGSWGGLGSDTGESGSPEYDYGQRTGYGGGSRYPEQSYGQHGYGPTGGGREQGRGRGPQEGREGWGSQRGYGGEYAQRGYGGEYAQRGFDPQRGRGGREGQGHGQPGSGSGERGAGPAYGSYGGSMGGRERQGYAGRGPKNYQRSDQRVLEDVCQTLERHPEIDASEIEVSCERGEVVLRGTVDDRHARRMAEQCIEDLPGVKDVRNELRVQARGELQQATAQGGLSGSGSVGGNGSASHGVTGGTETGPASGGKSGRAGERGASGGARSGERSEGSTS